MNNSAAKKKKRRTQADIEFNPLAGAFFIRQAGMYCGGLSVPTMRRLVRDKKIKPNRELRHLLFPRVELDRFLNEGA